LARACRYDLVAAVAEEKLFGASPLASVTLGALDEERLVGVVVAAGPFLRLLAVDPASRGRGAGRALLDAATKATGGSKTRTAAQPGNYLTPGIDARDDDTISWFERRGFTRLCEHENLRVPLCENRLVCDERAEELAGQVSRAGYVLCRAEEKDRDELLTRVGQHYSAAWAFEVARALEIRAVHVARQGEDLVAFAAHDGNNRGMGAFGPAGTLETHRGKGLGLALLVRCLLDAKAAGHTEGVIAWVGPREFYVRAVGAMPDRRFVVLERTP
jgi:GNAT superfamily N-acetyltransferase